MDSWPYGDGSFFKGVKAKNLTPKKDKKSGEEIE